MEKWRDPAFELNDDVLAPSAPHIVILNGLACGYVYPILFFILESKRSRPAYAA